jgi:hypothetical protein
LHIKVLIKGCSPSGPISESRKTSFTTQMEN